MVKWVFIFVCFIWVFPLTTLDAQGLRNSHHDFSGAAWSGNEFCKPCHTPHNAAPASLASPLWNHQLTTATFTLYSSATLDAVPQQPGGKSKLCLSCHDGTVAYDNHSGITSGTRYVTFGNITTDLKDDHPISFRYDAALATQDGHLYDPSTKMSGLGGTIEEDLLENGYMECTSCHDVHLSRNTQGCIGCHDIHGSGTYTETLSLWITNFNSTLCLTCHKL
ncbi:MAG: cytochrome C [Chlorobi bacterium]|nr:cytochrome C [Chlorobiota bacterium]